tara:strand:+ start:217 stop:768 length:552 start_codon:yes stop_codon:yes gene_type:complete
MIFTKKNNSILIEEIYQNIIERSRLKYFYLNKKVEDTVESRFDLIIFHSFIIFQFYREMEIKDDSLAQNLFDYMFKDFENNLREMGFGDVAVNKKMKVFISAFYGRVANYSKGIEMYRTKKDKEKLSKSIKDNIYKSKSVPVEYIDFFVNYLLLNINSLKEKPLNENISHRFNFVSFKKIELL